MVFGRQKRGLFGPIKSRFPGTSHGGGEGKSCPCPPRAPQQEPPPPPQTWQLLGEGEGREGTPKRDFSRVFQRREGGEGMGGGVGGWSLLLLPLPRGVGGGEEDGMDGGGVE